MTSLKDKLLLDNYPTPSLVFELNNLRIKAANDAALSLYEYSLDEILSLTIKALRPPEEVPKMMKYLKERFKGNDTVGVWQHQTKNGKPIFVNIVSNTIPSEKDTNVLVTMHDVTPYKDLEERYRTTLTYLDVFKDHLPGMYYILDSEGSFLEWNKQTETISEYSEQEISDMTLQNLVTPTEQKKVTENLRKALKNGEGELETTVLSKSKKIIPVSLNAQKIINDGNEQIFVTCIERPDHIEINSHSIQQQKLLQTIIDQANSIIYIKDEEGRFRFVNRAFLDLFNLTNNKVIGKINTDLLELEDIHQVILSDELVKSTGKPFQLEEKVHIEGEVRTFLSTKMLLNGVENFENWIFGTSTDITERVKTEALLEEYLRENEVLLKEIHHRVKNNLAVITGLVELQVMECRGTEYENKLKNIQSRIKSIALTHELLYQRDYFSQIDFSKNVKNIAESISCLFNSNVNFDFQLEPVDLNINQALPCSLMLNEIITNSIKHAFFEIDKPKMEISLSEKGEEIVLSVHDNGCGLPEEINLENPSTLGFKLMMILKDQLGAELDINSNQGLIFKLRFKKSNIRGVGSSLI